MEEWRWGRSHRFTDVNSLGTVCLSLLYVFVVQRKDLGPYFKTLLELKLDLIERFKCRLYTNCSTNIRHNLKFQFWTTAGLNALERYVFCNAILP